MPTIRRTSISAAPRAASSSLEMRSARLRTCRGLVAERGGEDGRRENADAVGAEVLEEPGDRGEDGGAPDIASREQRRHALGWHRCDRRGEKIDALRIGGVAREQPHDSSCASLLRPRTSSQCALSVMLRRPSVTSTAGMIAVAYIQRQAPMCGMFVSTTIADDRSDQRADGLKAECARAPVARAHAEGMLSEMMRWAVG